MRSGKEIMTAGIILMRVSFKFFNKTFRRIINIIGTNSGRNTRDVLKVYIAKVRHSKESIKNFGFNFSRVEDRNNVTPSTIKKVATFASKAARDKRICQGEIARRKAERRA